MKTKMTILVFALFFFAASAFAQGGKAEPNRIKFAKGKSRAILSGTLSNNEQMEYVFGAKAGQTITLKVVSNPKGNLFNFTIDGDGFDVETEYDSYSEYSFTAPQTGDYLVFVRKRPTDKVPKARFSLSVSIK